MNAVTVSRHVTPREDVLPVNEDSRDGIHRSDQLAELRSDVRHLQSDVTDLKTEVRTINQRIDVLSDKVDKRLDVLSDRVDKKLDVLRDKIEDVGKSLGSAKLWAVLLFSSVVAQLLYVIARGLKWP
jgi:archaellum component FlaC